MVEKETAVLILNSLNMKSVKVEESHDFVPGILTNGVHGFGLGDYEWLLSFETNDLGLLVNCVHRLRDCKARLYTKDEYPFIVGRRFELEEILSQYM